MRIIFDITPQIIDAQVIVPEEDAEVGPEGGVLQVALVVGMALPVGPNQAAQIPVGIIRVSLGKERSASLGAEIAEKSEGLKAPSKISVASAADLSGVEKAAQQAQGLRG